MANKTTKSKKTVKRNNKLGLLTRLNRRFSTKHKAIIFSALFGVVGAALIIFTRASSPIIVGSQFHCTWGNYSDTQRAAALDKLAAAHIDWVRIDMGWSAFQENSRDTYSQWYVNIADTCVNMARARGINVLATVHQTPGWANGNQGTGVPPTDLNDYANFALWISNHFKGRIAAYEVWNEPDPNQSFWKGTTAQYVDMLKLAYPKFKAGDPNAKVVLGGPSSNDDVWINQVYSLGAKDYFDVMATHPYQGQADQPPEYPDDNHRWWFTHFPVVLKVMQNYGDGSKEVWFTEFGWSSHTNTSGLQPWQLGVTPDQQGDYFVRAVKYAQANYPNVTHMFWYTERNRTDADVQNNNYGLMLNDLTPKPAYFAIQTFLASRTGTSDTVAPVANITSPTSGATVSGTVTVQASVSDNIGVVRTELYVDGQLKSTSSSSPFTFSINTANFTNGGHVLQVRAYDAANNVGNSTDVNITVSNSTPPADTLPPVVTISRPSAGDVIGNKLIINASASDNKLVSTMQAFIDGKPIGSVVSGGTIGFNYNSRKLSRGSHTITVIATDSSGNKGTSTVSIIK
ncbi:MAG TPA: Ig-like domain-containing protein [Patescibacteria group bacterium]|nr:Ig-like domain-containing protein [Patescibacteria group bacterium]